MADSHRRLTLITSAAVLAANLVTIHIYKSLPDDPLHLAWHLSLYSHFATVLSVLGFVGAKRGNATLIYIFANYLLIDTLISVIPRVVAVTLFPTVRASLCSAETIHAWLQSQTQSIAIATDEHIRGDMIAQCRRVVGVLQALAALAAFAVTIVQGIIALRISVYARRLCRQQDEVEQREKDREESGKYVPPDEKLPIKA